MCCISYNVNGSDQARIGQVGTYVKLVIPEIHPDALRFRNLHSRDRDCWGGQNVIGLPSPSCVNLMTERTDGGWYMFAHG